MCSLYVVRFNAQQCGYEHCPAYDLAITTLNGLTALRGSEQSNKRQVKEGDKKVAVKPRSVPGKRASREGAVTCPTYKCIELQVIESLLEREDCYVKRAEHMLDNLHGAISVRDELRDEIQAEQVRDAQSPNPIRTRS